MSDAPYATTISPVGAAILVFTIAFTIAGLIFVPTLVRPTSSRQERWLSVICLACGFFLSAFLAFYGAFTGIAANGRIENGRYFVGDHGYYTEVSPTVYAISNILHVAGVISLLVLAICGRRLNSIQSK